METFSPSSNLNVKREDYGRSKVIQSLSTRNRNRRLMGALTAACGLFVNPNLHDYVL